MDQNDNIKRKIFNELLDSGIDFDKSFELANKIAIISNKFTLEPQVAVKEDEFINADNVFDFEPALPPSNSQIIEAASQNSVIAAIKNSKTKAQNERRRIKDVKRVQLILKKNPQYEIGFVFGTGFVHLFSLQYGKRTYGCGTTNPAQRTITAGKCVSSEYVPCRKCLTSVEATLAANKTNNKRMTTRNVKKIINTIMSALRNSPKPLSRKEIEDATKISHLQSRTALRNLRQKKLVRTNGGSNHNTVYFL